MSEENKEGNKVQANPYNMRKSWHTDNVMPTDLQNADSGLFVPNPDSNKGEPEATAQTSNPEGSTNNTTAPINISPPIIIFFFFPKTFDSFIYIKYNIKYF